jgi:predicted dehydrogenase
VNTGLKPDLSLEDNAILILKYPHALATTEASWTQIGNLTSYSTTIYGSAGTVHIEPGHGGRILHATAEHPDGIELTVPPQPGHLQNASLHFLAAIEDPAMTIHPLCDAGHGLNAQWILEEGIKATA